MPSGLCQDVADGHAQGAQMAVSFRGRANAQRFRGTELVLDALVVGKPEQLL